MLQGVEHQKLCGGRVKVHNDGMKDERLVSGMVGDWWCGGGGERER